MAEHKILVPFIQKWEGGWADDPADRGGATMAGVTIATYRNYCKLKGLPVPTEEQLRNITQDEWMEIFKTLYWDKWQGDKILSQKVANILVDWIWASGSWGIKIPQRVLGVASDGVVGAITLQVLNSRNPDELYEAIYQERIKFVDNIVAKNPVQQRFIKGWKNRINDIVNI